MNLYIGFRAFFKILEGGPPTPPFGGFLGGVPSVFHVVGRVFILSG